MPQTYNSNQNLKYTINENGERVYSGDARFSPSPKNFHKVRCGNNILEWLLGATDAEWRKSQRYQKLCRRLYNDGFKQLEYLRKLDEELSEKELLKHIERCYKIGSLTEKEYEYRKRNIKEYTIERREYEMRFDQCNSLDYKIQLYEKVFGNGFRNFVNITLKNGHVIDGYEIICYDVMNFDCFERDRSFYVKL